MRLELTHGLHRQLRHNPSAVATVFGSRRQTWSQIGDRSARLAGALQQLGMQKGDRVGLLAQNTDRYLEYMVGVWWGGGALNPVNVRWSPAEVAFSLDDCDTQILLIDDNFAAWGEDLKARSKSLRQLIYVGDGKPPEGVLDCNTLLAVADPIPDCRSGGEDLAGVFYTGGTTGFPKGVMLSHNALLGNALGCLLEVDFAEDEIILAVAPMFHQAGMCMVIRALVRGCRTVFVEIFDPPKVLEAISTERASFTLMVPTMLQRLIDCPGFAEFDVTSMRHIIYGASPISETLLGRLLKLLPSVSFYQGYGMTETGGPYTVLPSWCHRSATESDRRRLRSAGRPVWGMEMRIVDIDGGDVPTGTVGEIASRGISIMQGYWKREKETSAAFRDGWLRSGDMGFVDEDGFVYIVDRLKDMIVTGGENVYSAEVENALSRHPAVASCAVIGIPSERWGEQVHAVVVLVDGQQADAAELREFCKQHIAGYKCPASVEFRDSLPLSGAGKLLKHVLREPYWDGRSRRVG